MTEANTELLLLPDGRILAHNLTPEIAALLAQFCQPEASPATRSRAARQPRRPEAAPILPARPANP